LVTFGVGFERKEPLKASERNLKEVEEQFGREQMLLG
jgi:hypothetical protein